MAPAGSYLEKPVHTPGAGVGSSAMGMRIGIVGAGAIGCVVGGLLTRAGHTPDPPNVEPLLKLVE